jgi:hypothetical protein
VRDRCGLFYVESMKFDVENVPGPLSRVGGIYQYDVERPSLLQLNSLSPHLKAPAKEPISISAGVCSHKWDHVLSHFCFLSCHIRLSWRILAGIFLEENLILYHILQSSVYSTVGVIPVFWEWR